MINFNYKDDNLVLLVYDRELLKISKEFILDQPESLPMVLNMSLKKYYLSKLIQIEKAFPETKSDFK